jgi:membrane-anchored protein YejM (alkaline phosphatase superfamily)
MTIYTPRLDTFAQQITNMTQHMVSSSSEHRERIEN